MVRVKADAAHISGCSSSSGAVHLLRVGVLRSFHAVRKHFGPFFPGRRPSRTPASAASCFRAFLWFEPFFVGALRPKPFVSCVLCAQPMHDRQFKVGMRRVVRRGRSCSSRPLFSSTDEPIGIHRLATIGSRAVACSVKQELQWKPTCLQELSKQVFELSKFMHDVMFAQLC